MKLKASLLAALLALSLSLVACGGSSDSSTGSSAATGAETEAPTEAGGEEAAEEEAAEGEEAEGEEVESETAPSGQARKAEKVEIVEFAYSPDPVVVQVGGKVTWKNEDTPPHTATAKDGSFDTGIIETGKQKSETFKEAGTFAYYCTVHPFMHGTVEVVEKE